MEDAELLRQLAALFQVEENGTVTWPWMLEATVSEAGTPALEAALKAYRIRAGIANML